MIIRRRPGHRVATTGVVALVVLVLAGCASAPPTDPGGSTSEKDTTEAVAVGIVRVELHGQTYDLHIERDEPRTDAGGDPPACLDKIGKVQFGLNWAASDLHRPVPAVTVSLRADDRTPLVIGDPQTGCRRAVDTTFKAMPENTQLVLPAASASTETAARRLRITINGKDAVVPLQSVCRPAARPTSARACDDGPFTWDASTSYSVSLHLP